MFKFISFLCIEISHSIALCEPFPLYILLLYQIIVHSISLFCYISFFTFILIRIYLQWSSYPISIGHPSSSSHKWNSCPYYLIYLELYFAVQFSEFVFVEIFSFSNYNIFDLQQLILLFIFYLKSLCTAYVMRTV